MKNKPYREDRIMAVVADGDFMPENSCNKLLKTLEEPNPGNVILILTSNPQRLCDTVRSRCVTLKLPQSFPRVSADVRADAKAVLSASIFGRKPIVEAFDRIEPYCAESSDAKELLSAMALFLRDLAVGAYAEQLIAEEENRPIIAEMRKRKHFCATRLIPLIEETRADVERGMNRKHCMRSMVIRFRQEARHG
jgi:DNA polymerase III gamma/tau subunit